MTGRNIFFCRISSVSLNQTLKIGRGIVKSQHLAVINSSDQLKCRCLHCHWGKFGETEPYWDFPPRSFSLFSAHPLINICSWLYGKNPYQDTKKMLFLHQIRWEMETSQNLQENPQCTPPLWSPRVYPRSYTWTEGYVKPCPTTLCLISRAGSVLPAQSHPSPGGDLCHTLF